jgi:hypothetical protein
VNGEAHHLSPSRRSIHPALIEIGQVTKAASDALSILGLSRCACGPRGRCLACGRWGALEVHHVVKRAQGGSDFDLDRLVALCPPCHALTDATGVAGWSSPRSAAAASPSRSPEGLISGRSARSRGPSMARAQSGLLVTRSPSAANAAAILRNRVSVRRDIRASHEFQRLQHTRLGTHVLPPLAVDISLNWPERVPDRPTDAPPPCAVKASTSKEDARLGGRCKTSQKFKLRRRFQERATS